ncbi:MAG: nucleoside deaminase [Tissierella sp.]|uniref:nucleoside deaminase n=1 Tax=Tissierella sp. TaxID=41274 RepID=UPI003F9BCA63
MGLKDDKYYIEKAIKLAYQAKEDGDNPFGSILVDEDGNILMEDKNTQITKNDITGHPELQIAKRAAEKYDEEFLKKCTMYNSAEPCTMCTGAIYWSGIGRIVFGISKKRLNELKSDGKGSINYSIHELLDNSGKDFEIIGPMESMKEEVEKPHK